MTRSEMQSTRLSRLHDVGDTWSGATCHAVTWTTANVNSEI